ncbi:MAG: Nramp family divalent metal transporter, partial [Planctomycetes bacterium]|nr:Nramp family divalent metal transporter [Planctomycetota bacterium]
MDDSEPAPPSRAHRSTGCPADPATAPTAGSRHGLVKALGPGCLFAAVSVGASHLVQSTRAGAGYGFSLMAVIVLALVLKYPLFEFGQRYATATGHTLLEGYRRQGRWTLVLYVVLTLGTMFTVLAAVTAATAGLAIQLTGLPWPVLAWSAVLLGGSGLLLVVGRYRLLDKAIKGIMIVLAVSTLAATVTVLPRLGGLQLFGPVGLMDVAFVVGLVGWMPTGMDVSVWQSFWALARRAETGHAPTLKETRFDFNLGYVGTGCLALMFCTLGTAVMFDQGVRIETAAGAFAGQVIDLYVSSLGPWSRPIIAVAAFTTMLSTMLTVLDGFPRALQLAGRRLRGPEDPEEVASHSGRSWDYWAWMAAQAAGAMLILTVGLSSLTDLVDLATILSFLTAPLLGILTYRAIVAPWVPAAFRPAPWLR